MYLSEKQAVKSFSGTGEVNKAGDDLVAFLKKYDPNKYQNPCNTVDTLVFAYKEEKGVKQVTKLLLIKRGNHPSIGWWALPGGFVEFKEDIADAALRELKEETGIDNIEAEQLKSYGAYDRDPRTRIITTAYVALVPEGSLRAQAGDDASDSGWFDISDELLEEKESENGLCYEKHRLILNCNSNNVRTETTVGVKWNGDAVLQNKNYYVEDTSMLAADHGAIVLEGYHYICARLLVNP